MRANGNIGCFLLRQVGQFTEFAVQTWIGQPFVNVKTLNHMVRVDKNMTEKLALKHSVQLAEIERKLTGFEKRLEALEKGKGKLSKKRLTEIANEFERLITK